jgi:hydroxymethylpyrimidine pyrophosphatase-like HAD family hydrolase
MSMQQLKIAVDFDGTIVENAYPYIGRKMPFAFQTLKMLQKEGHLLILWTRRSGKTLEQALEYCTKNGVEFYAVNKSYPEEIFDENESRKIEVDVFVDDRIVGGFPGWGVVYQQITGQDISVKKTKSNFIKMLFHK